MKVNKVIYLTFNTTNTASTFINVNFPVKSIHVKGMVYQTGGNIPANAQVYIAITSDLTNGEPLGYLYNDTDKAPTIPFNDISFTPYKPINVNGVYTFRLYTLDGLDFTTLFGDYISIILEFNGVDTIEH